PERALQRFRLRSLRRDLPKRARRALPVRPERPEELRERADVADQGLGCAGVRDRGLDLLPVADDRGVVQEPLDVALAEARDALDPEACERAPERVALAQDRQPREAGLERLEAEALVERVVVSHRPAP